MTVESKWSFNYQQYLLYVYIYTVLLHIQHCILSFAVKITYHSSCKRVLQSVEENQKRKNDVQWVINPLGKHIYYMLMLQNCVWERSASSTLTVVLWAKNQFLSAFSTLHCRCKESQYLKAKYHHRLHISFCNHLSTQVMTHKKKSIMVFSTSAGYN